LRSVETIMPPKTAVPTEWRLAWPAPEGKNNGRKPGVKEKEGMRRRRSCGRDAEDEGEEAHEDGPQPDARRLDRRLDRRAAAGAELLGELDDQDRVLGRQADQHHQADLAVDVVLQAADRLRREGAEDGERHGEED